MGGSHTLCNADFLSLKQTDQLLARFTSLHIVVASASDIGEFLVLCPICDGGCTAMSRTMMVFRKLLSILEMQNSSEALFHLV